MTVFAQHQPEAIRTKLIDEALVAARSSEAGYARANALLELLPHVPEALKVKVACQALAASQAIKENSSRARILASLLPLLPQPSHAEVLSDAVKAAQNIEDLADRARVSANIAVHSPNRLRQNIIEIATEAANAIENARSKAEAAIPWGTEIVVVPEMKGCRFNPPQAAVNLMEDWHRVDFRMQAAPELKEFELDMAANGRLAFYVGPLLVAEVKFWAYISEEAKEIQSKDHQTKLSVEPYQSVFVSYAHSDTTIVEQLEKAYTALGIQYLRDVNLLRSGEKWNPALLEKIVEADIFQLCWSKAAKGSKYVEQEWQHALGLHRVSFIRPVYWKKPLPDRPKELAEVHFAYLEVDSDSE